MLRDSDIIFLAGIVFILVLWLFSIGARAARKEVEHWFMFGRGQWITYPLWFLVTFAVAWLALGRPVTLTSSCASLGPANNGLWSSSMPDGPRLRLPASDRDQRRATK
jgi:hypothetical protein